VVKKSINITAPPGLGAGVLWDTHIFTLPERNTFFAGGQAASIFSLTDTTGSLSLNGPWNAVDAFPVQAPFNVRSVQAGQNTLPTLSAGVIAPPPTVLQNLSLDFNDYFAGNSRVIGMAFEVHNVTNKLNVQGTVTVYRLPQNLEIATNQIDLLSAPGFPTTTMCSRMPPANIQEALLLPDSKQWEAEKGSLHVSVGDLEHNPAITSQFGARTYISGDYVGGLLANPSVLLPSWTTFLNSENSGGLYFKPIPFATSGAFYTGLSQATVLTCTVHVIVETFPTYTSPLVTLARPAPNYDPNFFELYKAVAQELPPAVEVSENAEGGWWKTVLDVVDSVAPVIPFVGPAIKAGTSALKTITAAQTPMNKAANAVKTSTVDQQFGSKSQKMKAAATQTGSNKTKKNKGKKGNTDINQMD
jgi:hypothetical protein